MTAKEFKEMFSKTKLSELSDEELCALSDEIAVAAAQVKIAIIHRKHLRARFTSKEKK